MKRIFAIMAAIVLCFSLTIPAFADEYNGIALPKIQSVAESDNFERSFIYLDESKYYLVLFDSVEYVNSAGNVIPSGGHVTYSASVGDAEWQYWGVDMFEAIQSPSIVWTSDVIYGKDGSVLVDKGDVVFDDPLPILSSVIPAHSLSGALGEVVGLLICVLPVLVGLFGIRKGIAFLMQRVRGS